MPYNSIAQPPPPTIVHRRENNLFQSTRGTRQTQKLIKLHDSVAQYSHLSPPLSDGDQNSSSEIIVHQTGEIRHRYLFCNLETRGDKVLASPAPLCRLVPGRGGLVVLVHNPGYNGKSPKRSFRQWGQLCVGRLYCHHLSENANYLIPWR